jgi:hypothetical protein
VSPEMKKEKKEGCAQRRKHLGTIRTSPRLYRSGSVQSSEGGNSVGVNPVIVFFFETGLRLAGIGNVPERWRQCQKWFVGFA